MQELSSQTFDRNWTQLRDFHCDCVSNVANLGLGSLLSIDAGLLTHGSEDNDV
jgi:hypothetical protein